MEKRAIEPDMVFGSFASAVGLALGELLLLAGRPGCLGECLASIEVTAYATILSLDTSGVSGPRGRSLSSAALRVVRVWHEEDGDRSSLGTAIEALQDVLELMGVRYVTTGFREK
jgi:hypothetical protein